MINNCRRSQLRCASPSPEWLPACPASATADWWPTVPKIRWLLPGR